MKEIGGYLELEFSNIELGIHSNSIKLNTGRNCLEYILLAKGYEHLCIPYFTCDAILEPLQKHNIGYTFYHIDERLEPITLPNFEEKVAFLYTNYFGLKDKYINWLQQRVGNLIIDNSQALFAPNHHGVDTFYSLRKFVGTPDGAFLYCSKNLNLELEPATSFRVSHLYKRKNKNAAYGFDDFKINELALSGLPIMSISSSTNHFVSTYDFNKNKFIREKNFLFLHSHLVNQNNFSVYTEDLNGPLCYPLIVKQKGLKELLINNKIFVPTYWPNVMEWLIDKNNFENVLVDSLICLPIDQRYTLDDMKRIISFIQE